MDKDEVETILRALIASNKGGIPIDELDSKYIFYFIIVICNYFYKIIILIIVIYFYSSGVL